MRFFLRKVEEGTWPRLTNSSDTVKNHRVWWEKQDQVERQDREMRTRNEEFGGELFTILEEGGEFQGDSAHTFPHLTGVTIRMHVLRAFRACAH